MLLWATAVGLRRNPSHIVPAPTDWRNRTSSGPTTHRYVATLVKAAPYELVDHNEFNATEEVRIEALKRKITGGIVKQIQSFEYDAFVSAMAPSTNSCFRLLLQRHSRPGSSNPTRVSLYEDATTTPTKSVLLKRCGNAPFDSFE
mmetsp:Transcript_4317/g.5953  ORF Transcript_4317/g.5953 Transcript_4317/m.5953 type:complete len:145 (-) Transcript_4317:516-950(-)